MSIIVSVIIPIYNVEKYLHECVDSILSQSYKNLEVILVDDGSPDNCSAICDEYAAKDTRIKVIHKKNGGLSDARNTGLKAATGDYVLFVDSDDFYTSKTAVEGLVAEVEKDKDVDIVFFSRTTIKNGVYFPSTAINPKRINEKSKIEGLRYLLEELGDLRSSAYEKLMRRTLLIDNELFFEKGLLSEDWDWTIGVYEKSKKIAAVSTTFYGYRRREDSITASVSDKHIDDMYYIISKWDKKLSNSTISSNECEIYKGFLAYIYCCILATLLLAKETKRKEMQTKFKAFTHLLQYDICWKTKQTAMVYRLLGYNLTCWLLRLYLKIQLKTRR